MHDLHGHRVWHSSVFPASSSFDHVGMRTARLLDVWKLLSLVANLCDRLLAEARHTAFSIVGLGQKDMVRDLASCRAIVSIWFLTHACYWQ